MTRLPVLILGCLLCLVCAPTAVLNAAELQESIPGAGTPKKLAEAWLRFHDKDLCQGIDADFVFNKNGMEVRGQIEDNRSYEKLEAMLNPLRSSYDINLQLKQRQEEKKRDPEKEKDPPASLWENLELRSFLGDTMARARVRVDFDDGLFLDIPPPNEMLKQRLLIYAERVLEWNRKMIRYAKDLPDLTQVAHDSALPSGLRARARSVVIDHARKMDRLISKLQSNLEPAFPRGENSDGTNRSGKAEPNPKNIVVCAGHLSEYAQTVSRRVHQFIYPERYTVSLDELRRPSLLESLQLLRSMSGDFLRAFPKAK
jgi:hypothetical protein